MAKKLRMFGCLASFCLLTACGGSGAGDTGNTNDNAAIPDTNTAGGAIDRLAGTWQLPGNWSGQANDIALLLIRSPGADGLATVVVYDFDDVETGLGQDCYRIDGLPGTISQSLSNQLFMDGVSAFPEAVVSRSDAGELVIVYSDVPSASTDRETTTLVAIQVSITETDITPLCSN